MVKELVSLHSGEVNAESNGANCGSSFEVTLPITNVNEPEPSSNEKLSTKANEKKILVVDDNEDAALTLASLLELNGHVVETAFSGKHALEKAATFNPQFIFLDIGLPDMTGYDLAQALKVKMQGQDIVLLH